MIALLAAVPLEIELLRRELGPCEARLCGRRELLVGSLRGRPTTLLVCGLGKANTAAAAALLLQTWQPEALVMVGCGGAYPGSGLAPGDLALATEEVYGDEGVAAPEGFLDLKAIGLPAVEADGEELFNRFPIDPGLFDLALRVLPATAASQGRRFARGPFVTVSTCSGTDELASTMARRTGGLCENMEGAAAAQICAGYGVPFLEIRGISNRVENRDPTAWKLAAGARIAQAAVLDLWEAWPEQKEPA